MVSTTDRVTLLREPANSAQFTGIDFVHIVDPCDQTLLHIFFLTDITTDLVAARRFTGANILTPDSIVIESATDPNLPRIRVTEISAVSGDQGKFNSDLQRSFIEIRVEKPGDFTQYRLRIDDPIENPSIPSLSRIDPFFNNVEFSFKVACETILDCEKPPPECPPEDAVDFPVDYLARDFVSFRNALLDFASQRYPQWAFPLVPDVGVMMMEIFAALGDEFSYIQDRHAREAFLETADQRRSLRKKARLLDYEIHDGRSAATFLDLTVDEDEFDSLFPDPETDIPEDDPANFEGDPPHDVVVAGDTVWAPAEGRAPIPFEIGLGIHDRDEDQQLNRYAVRPQWNRGALELYVFDDSQICLPVGATELVVVGAVFQSELLVSDERPPRRMLLALDPDDPGIVQRRIFVRLSSFTEETDPLTGTLVTRIKWDERDALQFQLDQNFLSISLNIVPATAGETLRKEFFTGTDASTPFAAQLAVEREAPLTIDDSRPDGSTREAIFLFGLQETEDQGLGFLGESLRSSAPELRVLQIVGDDEEEPWSFQKTLLGSDPADTVFTLEDGSWRRVRTFRRLGVEFQHKDYASSHGFSVRFGDGVFGRVPDRGSRFIVEFRTGPGTLANLPAGAVKALEVVGSNGVPLPGKAKELPPFVIEITNPVEITTGVDPESAREIKLLVPEAYQADVLFAVRPEDYGEQAEKLDFVQRANGTQRWTGSWLSMFVAADPLGSNSITLEQRELLENWMNCVRQAGREVIVRDPNTLPIDLIVTLCIEPFAHPGQILPLVEEVLLGKGRGRRIKGFFHPDNFTFGTPLRRSALEAAIQRIPGVRSVRRMRIRERGQQSFHDFTELTLKVDPDQVLRLDNDPLHPGNGTLELVMEGGA